METMTEEEYSFYLAYGVKDDEELSLIEFIDSYFTIGETQTGNTCTN